MPDVEKREVEQMLKEFEERIKTVIDEKIQGMWKVLEENVMATVKAALDTLIDINVEISNVKSLAIQFENMRELQKDGNA